MVGLSQPSPGWELLTQGTRQAQEKQPQTGKEGAPEKPQPDQPTPSAESASPVAAPAGGSIVHDASTSEDKPTPQKGIPQTSNDLPIWARVSLEFLRIVVSWPVALALLVLYFVVSKAAPYKLARVLKPFRSLKLFGTEFVLSEEVGADAEQAIEIYRKQVKRQFDTLVEIYDIRAKLEAVVDQVLAVARKRKEIKDPRCTLHVPDILFADTLYQLTDYYPSGGGRGRTFSSRFGIIGLCWRSREHEIRGAVPTDPQKLVREWGMTHEQAVASGTGRQSFLVILLLDESETPVAIFYMDSKDQNEFGADSGDEEFRGKLRQAVISESKGKGLIASITKMRDGLKERRPAIRIHEQ